MSMLAGASGPLEAPFGDRNFGGTDSVFTPLDFQSEGGRIIGITSDPIQDRMGR